MKQKNLAADPSYSNLVKEMKSEIDKRWNYDELEQKIIKSQSHVVDQRQQNAFYLTNKSCNLSLLNNVQKLE